MQGHRHYVKPRLNSNDNSLQLEEAAKGKNAGSLANPIEGFLSNNTSTTNYSYHNNSGGAYASSNSNNYNNNNSNSNNNNNINNNYPTYDSNNGTSLKPLRVLSAKVGAQRPGSYANENMIPEGPKCLNDIGISDSIDMALRELDYKKALLKNPETSLPKGENSESQ